MKFSKMNSMAILVAIVFSGNVFAQINMAEIVATGLTCSMCSNAINKQLYNLDDVDSVSTDLNTNTFVVYLKKGNQLKPRVLKESIEKAGFFIGSLILFVPTDSLIPDSSNTILLNGSTFILLNEKPNKKNGETKFKIYDKGYVTQKEYKKLLKSLKISSYPLNNEDDYHIKFVNL
ncbi:MAG: heavy-metal-associated domain-containing protein [Saprospiraceae bacterium]|nr:heavy-metal-associated domain-containing protein [Saprospiraceae bacterium]